MPPGIKAASTAWSRHAAGPTATGTFYVAAQPAAVRALVTGTCGEETLIELR